MWKNSQRKGKGIYYYNNGDRYEGNWKNDTESKGIMYYKNGDKKIGNLIFEILILFIILN